VQCSGIDVLELGAWKSAGKCLKTLMANRLSPDPMGMPVFCYISIIPEHKSFCADVAKGMDGPSTAQVPTSTALRDGLWSCLVQNFGEEVIEKYVFMMLRCNRR
jgi:hypothetical protein